MPVEKDKAVINSTNPTDRASSTKTIYDVSIFQVFFRNIIAGAARALGGVLMYIAFIVIIGQILAQVFWPRMRPYIDSYMSAIESLSQTSQTIPQGVSAEQLQQILDSTQ